MPLVGRMMRNYGLGLAARGGVRVEGARAHAGGRLGWLGVARVPAGGVGTAVRARGGVSLALQARASPGSPRVAHIRQRAALQLPPARHGSQEARLLFARPPLHPFAAPRVRRRVGASPRGASAALPPPNGVCGPGGRV